MNWPPSAWHRAHRSISMAGGAGPNGCLLSWPGDAKAFDYPWGVRAPASTWLCLGLCLWGKAGCPGHVPALGGHPSKGCNDACFATVPYIKYHSCHRQAEPITSRGAVRFPMLCHDEAAETRDLLQAPHAARDVMPDPGTTSNPMDPQPWPQPPGPSLGMETTGASRHGPPLWQARH